MELKLQEPIGIKDSKGKEIYVGDKLYDKNLALFIVILKDELLSIEEGQKEQDCIPLRKEFVKTLTK